VLAERPPHSFWPTRSAQIASTGLDLSAWRALRPPPVLSQSSNSIERLLVRAPTRPNSAASVASFAVRVPAKLWPRKQSSTCDVLLHKSAHTRSRKNSVQARARGSSLSTHSRDPRQTAPGKFLAVTRSFLTLGALLRGSQLLHSENLYELGAGLLRRDFNLGTHSGYPRISRRRLNAVYAIFWTPRSKDMGPPPENVCACCRAHPHPTVLISPV